MNNQLELLAPVGDEEKLNTALYFGADAVYLGGEDFGLRAQTGFDRAALTRAVAVAHACGRKVFVTVNVYAKTADFGRIDEYLSFLESVNVDGVIVSDLGIMSLCRKHHPQLALHISTQANTTNAAAASFYREMGARRIVLARELSLKEIAEIRNVLPQDTELECFVHGAMCMAYSGRCLLSTLLTGRSANQGACAQPCRWEYEIRRKSHQGEWMPIETDDCGSYILNSKDLNMIRHLGQLVEAGVTSFKIEGRMKTAYYVATAVNAYRRALDAFVHRQVSPLLCTEELDKISHRKYTTGFYFGAEEDTMCVNSTASVQQYDFCGVVKNILQDRVTVEMRNRFLEGDRLEIVSPYGELNRSFFVANMTDERGVSVTDAKRVQQLLTMDLKEELHVGDLLRKRSRTDEQP